MNYKEEMAKNLAAQISSRLVRVTWVNSSDNGYEETKPKFGWYDPKDHDKGKPAMWFSGEFVHWDDGRNSLCPWHNLCVIQEGTEDSYTKVGSITINPENAFYP